MTTTSTTTITTRPSTSTETTTRTPSEHYSISSNEDQERARPETRTKDSHLCITIDGAGPAFGRPEPTLRAVDLAQTTFKIVSSGGWSSW